jgi:hypothetical protein
MQQGDVVEIRFNPEKASRGLFEEPQPAIEPLAPVILVQRNDFLVGEWDDDCFVHPANQRELADAAENAVRAAFPTASFSSNTLRVFTCPKAIASQFDWEWTKE